MRRFQCDDGLCERDVVTSVEVFGNDDKTCKCKREYVCFNKSKVSL